MTKGLPTISPIRWRAIATIAALVSSASIALAAQPSVDGSNFSGWTKVGQSNLLGTYASGSTSEIYEIYSVVFQYDSSNPIPGTQGGFSNGNKILGIGVKRISGSADYPILKFDPDNNSYTPSTTLVGTPDGHTSFSTYSTIGDSVTHFPTNYGGQPSEITIKASPTNAYYPCGSYGCGNGLPGIRGVRGAPGFVQMFFDLDYLPTAYSSQLGTFGAQMAVAINNSSNNSVVTVSTLLPPPPPNAILDGFYPPVDKPHVATNEAKAGQTIPLKFIAKNIDGTPILNLTNAELKVVPFSCGSATPTLDTIEEYSSSPVTLQNFGNGAYQYNWKTPKSLANTCQIAYIDLPEPPYTVDPIMAEFRFKK